MGGGTYEVYKLFDGACITAIEYDSDMISFAKEFKPWQPFPEPTILYRDAAAVLKDLARGAFDLVVVDIFELTEADDWKSSRPSHLLLQEEFIADLKCVLKQDGLVVVNAFRNPEYLANLSDHFHTETSLIGENHIGYFSHKPETESLL